MGAYNIVNQSNLIAGQPEDVSVVLANLQAIQAILNGGIDNSNVSAAAAIAASKLSGYPTDATKFLRGDGAWTTIAAGSAYGGSVASAGTINLVNNSMSLLTGTTSVVWVTGPAGASPTTGAINTLVASGQATGILVILTHGSGNLRLRDGLNLGIYAGESVTFMYDGSNWIEIGRNLKKTITYTEAVTPVQCATSATTAAAATTAITGAAVTYDGSTPVVIEYFTGGLGNQQANNAQYANLWDGSTDIGRMVAPNSTILNYGGIQAKLERRLTPTNASHTYAVKIWSPSAASAAAYVYAGAAGTDTMIPMFIKVSRDL